MSVELDDEQPEPVPHARLRRLAEHVLEAEGVPSTMDLAVRCVDAEVIAELNIAHLDGEGPTDVLAFPLDHPDDVDPDADVPALLGDVVLCPAVARAQATAGISAELELLLVHGVLHLLGHDHAEDDERQVMEVRTAALLEAFRAVEGQPGDHADDAPAASSPREGRAEA